MAEDSNKNKKHFFKDMKTELKKVNWLTPKQLLNNTTAVLVMVVIVAAIVFVLDVVFETMYTKGVDGLKSAVVKDNGNTVNQITDGENNATGNTVSNEVQNTVTNTVEANN